MTKRRDEKYLKLDASGIWHLNFRVPVRFGGKLIRQSLYTEDFDVAASIRDRFVVPILALNSGVAALEEIIRGVVTGCVAPASRAAQKDGVQIHPGDYIGFVGDHIYVDAADRSRTLLGLAALWLALIAVGVCIKTDVFGVERRVPQADQVESVNFNVAYQYSMESEDPEVIDAVIALHRAAASGREGSDRGHYFNVTYRLKNGTTLERGYQMDISEPPVREALTKLMNLAPVRQNALLPDYGKYGETFTGGYIMNYDKDQEIILSEEQCLALYRALEKDMESHCTPEELVDKERFACQLELNTTQGTYYLWDLPQSCTNTLALLVEYGATFLKP